MENFKNKFLKDNHVVQINLKEIYSPFSVIFKASKGS